MYRIIDAISDEVLRDCLTLEAAEQIMMDSRQFPHAMKALERSPTTDKAES